MKSRNICNLFGYWRFDSLELKAYMNFSYGENPRGLCISKSFVDVRGDTINITFTLPLGLKKGRDIKRARWASIP